MRVLSTALFRLVFMLLASVLFTNGVATAAESGQILEQKRQDLFQIMLVQPDNIEVALDYAALSVKLDDLEGAVSTLERMLIFFPGNTRVQLELGVLYYKLGSFETSRSYFKAIANSSELSKLLAQRVQEYLDAIEKQLNPLRISGNTYLGLRWESNANGGPTSTNLTANGISYTISPSATAKSDFSGVMSNRAHIEYDLQNQGDKLEIDYVDFGALYFNQHQLNNTVAEVTIGPSFNLARLGIDGTFAGVYAILNGALIEKAWYFGSLGAGARLVWRPSKAISLFVKGEYRRRWYHVTNARPFLAGYNGHEYRGQALARYTYSSDLWFTAGGHIKRRDVSLMWHDFWEFGVKGQVDWLFDAPGLKSEFPWKLTLAAGFTGRRFDTPDPAVSAVIREQDTEWWGRAALKIPFAKSWAVIPKVEYRMLNSNYPTRVYNTLAATVGIQYKM